MTTTRPILKTRSSCDECFPSPSTALPFKFLHSPHVHFPPTPILADIQTTHSPFAYDRAPIAVTPNTCKLPERGSRVYGGFTMSEYPSSPKGSYFHPQSYQACEPEHSEPIPPGLPALILDLSSSSESELDSDACVSESSPAGFHSHEYSIPVPSEHSTPYLLTPTCPQDEALSFLPHPRTHSSVKERPKPKRRETGKRRPSALYIEESFSSVDGELSLDGCLGGF